LGLWRQRSRQLRENNAAIRGRARNPESCYDQVGSPTWSYDIAQAIAALIPHLNEDTYGLYHFTDSGAVSWYDFAVAIFEEAAVLNYPLMVRDVVPITSDQYPTAAQRPAYSVLAGDRLAQVIHQTAPHWRHSLRKMLRELLESQQP
jgi:dTDP-4-dehydrorhamnose reductase